MRRVSLLLIMISCALGEGRAPPPPPKAACAQIDETLVATQEALAEGEFEPIRWMLDPMLFKGELAPGLRQLLEDPESVQEHLGGNRLRPALGALLTLVRSTQPEPLLRVLARLVGDASSSDQTTASIIEFMLADAGRLAVVDPLRKMLTDCGEGRPLAQTLADMSGTELACGEALSCLLDELSGLARDPALNQALSELTLEGEEGRKAFSLLVARLMSSSAQAGFDVAQAQDLLRTAFGQRLPEDSLLRLDRLIQVMGDVFADDRRRANWLAVVTCTERHDTQRAVAGTAYDLLIGNELDVPELVDSLQGLLTNQERSDVMRVVHDLTLTLAQRDDLRLPLNAAIEPFLTVSVLRVLLNTLRSSAVQSVFEQWLGLLDEEMQCEPS